MRTLSIDRPRRTSSVALDGSALDQVGASHASVALGLARLGHDVILSTRIGDDEPGTRIASCWARNRWR